jgi:hypothetical protein
MRNFHRCSILGLILIRPLVSWAEPSPESFAAFDRYAQQLEQRLAGQHSKAGSFLYFQQPREAAMARLLAGESVIEGDGSPRELPGALLHHWRGSLYVPGAKAEDFLRIMQDYDHLASRFQPQVLSARLLERRGEDFKIAMRVRQHHILTVVLDTGYLVHYGELDAAHGYSASRSTQVWEIAGAGTKHEHALDVGSGHGYLYRINTYWSYAETSGGLLLQCESITLTRDVPRGLGWAVTPFIQSIPRESLEFTLDGLRRALEGRPKHDSR